MFAIVTLPLMAGRSKLRVILGLSAGLSSIEGGGFGGDGGDAGGGGGGCDDEYWFIRFSRTRFRGAVAQNEREVKWKRQ